MIIYLAVHLQPTGPRHFYHHRRYLGLRFLHALLSHTPPTSYAMGTAHPAGIRSRSDAISRSPGSQRLIIRVAV